MIDSDLSRRLRAYCPDCYGIRRRSLTKPADLEANTDEQTYHRLAVAWGLSYQKVDIGEISRPSEADDIESRELSDWRDGRKFSTDDDEWSNNGLGGS